MMENRIRKQRRGWLVSYLWSAPSLLLIALIVVFPILYTFFISLTNMNVYHWFDFTVIGLDNRYALLFIRGERPLLDEKYDILKHPNVALTTDGKALPYEHGQTDRAVAGVAVQRLSQKQKQPEPETTTPFTLLSDEELETLFEPKEELPDEQKAEETHPA